MRDWAIILGISSGMGAATAKELMKNGLNVYGIDIRKSIDLLNELEAIGKQNNSIILLFFLKSILTKLLSSIINISLVPSGEI